MDDVRREMATMKEAIKGKAITTVNELIQRTNHPFTLEAMAQSLPGKFKSPQMEMFDGTLDPLNHLEAYKTHVNLYATPNEIMCRDFPTTIRGSAPV